MSELKLVLSQADDLELLFVSQKKKHTETKIGIMKLYEI